MSEENKKRRSMKGKEIHSKIREGTKGKMEIINKRRKEREDEKKGEGL